MRQINHGQLDCIPVRDIGSCLLQWWKAALVDQGFGQDDGTERVRA